LAEPLSLDKTTADEPVTEDEQRDFIEAVDIFSRVVIDELSLREFPRMGVRCLYYFPCESKEESEGWLRGLGLFGVSQKLLLAFGATVEAAGASMVLTGQECRYRIALNGVEINAQIDMGPEILQVRASKLPEGQKAHLREQMKQHRRRQVNSGYAVVADVDAYHEDPPIPDPRDFATTHIGSILDLLRAAVAE